MKRLYSEGKIVLKTVLNKFNFLLIAFLIQFSEISPQIPINGFCKYNSYKINPGFSGSFAANFNRDSYTDLVLFNPGKKQILSLAGNQNGNFNFIKPYSVPVELSKIQSITNRNNVVTGYAFSSRKSRKAGIFEFLKDGRIKILQDIKLKSYPENISVADINRNGSNEILLSGSAFGGMSLLTLKNNTLVEETINSRTSYSNALFTDLSNDGLSDIAAVNLHTNSIDFFYNNGQGKFNKVRTINIDRNISGLKSFDLNFDYYEDLIYTSADKINILYGDPVSSYETKTVINTKYSPDKIITGDFNRDGRIDIVYLNYKEEVMSIIFAKDDSDFFPEIMYMKKNGLTDIHPFYSKFINGISAVSTGGMIYTITNLTSFSEVNISLGVLPSALSYFDYDNNGITDICFIDNYDSNLKIILRNASGIPDTYYYYPLYQNHSNIIVDNTGPKIKTFYCFTYDQRLIETIRIDFSSDKFYRQILYSPGEIKDLKISASEDGTKVYSAYIKNMQLGLSVISYHEFRYTSAEYSDIAANIAAAKISLTTPPALFYWQINDNKVAYSKYSPAAKSVKQLVKASLPGGEIKNVTSFAGDLLNRETDVSISFFKADSGGFVIISNEEMTRILQGSRIDSDFSDEEGGFNIPAQKDLFYGEIRLGGLKKLIYLNSSNSTLNRIDFINKGRSFISLKIADVHNAGSFFIKNMSYKKYHAVYTDQVENCITIKEI